MGGSAILVPIHLDGLYVKEGRSVASPTADFSCIPHFNKKYDIHARTPYVSEEVTRHPFEGNDFYLDAGIHLHWALPSALTKASPWANPDQKVSVFPSVPDRWLVIQGRLEGGNPIVQQRWIVESNYIATEPPTSYSGHSYVSIPYPADLARPFRYLGRTLELEVWKTQEHKPENYLQALTAIGYRETTVEYGEPSFAALYPNCHSVFGFFDGRYAGYLPPKGFFYEVIGWYSNPDSDYLPVILDRIREARQKEGKGIALDRALLTEVLNKQLQWGLPDQELPDGELKPQIVCYGRLTFNVQGQLELQPQLKVPKVTIANTVTEALSAHLALCVAGSANPSDSMVDSAKKAEIEEQLECVLLASQLEHRQVDIGAKFQEARHTKGFIPSGASLAWVVRPVESTQTPGETEEDIPLWPKVAQLLAELNKLQNAYNQAQTQIKSLCEQLYSDWYRYMLCAYPPEDMQNAYPDADELRFYIEQLLPTLQRKRAVTGELVPPLNANSQLPLIAASSSRNYSLAHRIEQVLSSLVQEINTHNTLEVNGSKAKQYVLQPIVAPAYWQPTEPVILLIGEASQVTERFGNNAQGSENGLPCHFYAWSEPGGVAANLDKIHDYLVTLPESKDSFGVRTWEGQPWHPFLLEWEVEITPFKSFSNQDRADQAYDPAFIKRNFSLKANGVDLVSRSQQPLLARGAFTYRGCSILTPHIVDYYQVQLEIYLKRLQTEHNQGNNPQSPTSPLTQETLNRLEASLNQLKQDKAVCLAQSLSGFNNALLMQQQAIQLPIDDPLGFSEDRDFAQRMREALGQMIHRAPQPLNDFCPIRTGELRLLRLRLVDSFGQRIDIPCHTCNSSETLPIAQSSENASVMLPPRLVQPARLGFRWLSAAGDEQETNAHPETTPICGWVMANHLDDNLFVYSFNGEALGYLEVEAEAVVRWRSAPGREQPIIQLDQIDNPHLRRLVDFFLRGSAGFFKGFLEDLKNAQKTIVPESASQHPELAFLMGQPLALVRASLNLELQGYPAIHQGWDELLQDLNRQERETDGFTKVLFPIRLGEAGQLNDGLTVYWQETANGYEDEAYYIPYYEQAGEIPVGSDVPKCDFLYQSIAAPPLTIAMLIDPRGVVHATSGILPTKAISIPPHHYVDALQRIDMSFLVAPLLTDRVKQERQEMILPVPSEPGYTWTWLQKRGRSWQPPLPVKSGNLSATFASQSQICEGWLKLSHPNSDTSNGSGNTS